MGTRLSGRSLRWLFWAPRVLGVAYALFIGLFALDVPGQGGDFWPTLAGLVIHLIPTLALLAALGVAWRQAWLGGWLHLGLGLLLMVLWRGSFLAIPVLLTGALFLLEGWYGGKPQGGAARR
ncbi:DUF7670 domain-containing protein [Calidithermus chliarophilus]|uniref:DUF7670 domain-containing protein n=1 Tax=Calidithermus chliarophilus TaxID=52023 RepID=UPI000414CEA2|nr:hypothetical protein [Calidithermus chliarophilus]